MPDKTYDDIKEVLKEYDKPLQLKILDSVYMRIAKPNKLQEAKKKILMEQQRRATKNA